MHPIGARPEKRYRAAIEVKEYGRAPAWRHGEGLVARFRNRLFADKRVDDSVDSAALRRRIAGRNQFDRVVGHPEYVRKAPQRRGVVATDQPDACPRHEKWQHTRRIVVVAMADMTDKRHELQTFQLVP